MIENRDATIFEEDCNFDDGRHTVNMHNYVSMKESDFNDSSENSENNLDNFFFIVKVNTVL